MSMLKSGSRHVYTTRTIVPLTRSMATIKQSSNSPRRFAPLNASLSNSEGAPRLRGVVFDVDGTLCLPQNYMFKEMRAALDIPKSVDILDHIQSLSDEPEKGSNESPQSRAKEAIKQIERNAMQHQEPQPGLNELITYLSDHNISLALCTRNFELPVIHLLEKFVEEKARRSFWPLITREAKGVKPKPSPEGIWACVEAWNRGEPKLPDSVDGTRAVLEQIPQDERTQQCEAVIMVGDSVDDIEAGARAGAATVLLVNEENKHLLDEKEWPKRVDVAIERLDELATVLEKGFCSRW